MLTLKACLAHYAQWLLNNIPKPVYRIRGSYDAPLRGFFKALFYVERKEVLESAHSAGKHSVEGNTRPCCNYKQFGSLFLVCFISRYNAVNLHWSSQDYSRHGVKRYFCRDIFQLGSYSKNHNANCH